MIPRLLTGGLALFHPADDDSPPESRPPGSEGGWVRGALAIVVFLVTVWLYARP